MRLSSTSLAPNECEMKNLSKFKRTKDFHPVIVAVSPVSMSFPCLKELSVEFWDSFMCDSVAAALVKRVKMRRRRALKRWTLLPREFFSFMWIYTRRNGPQNRPHIFETDKRKCCLHQYLLFLYVFVFGYFSLVERRAVWGEEERRSGENVKYVTSIDKQKQTNGLCQARELIIHQKSIFTIHDILRDIYIWEEA